MHSVGCGRGGRGSGLVLRGLFAPSFRFLGYQLSVRKMRGVEEEPLCGNPSKGNTCKERRSWKMCEKDEEK